MAEQLAFPLPQLEAKGREAFFVSPANAIAVAQIEAWCDWPNRKLLLNGPEGSGKSHLAGIWAELSGANIVKASKIVDTDLTRLSETNLVVEDAEELSGSHEYQTTLFHLHNLLQAAGHALLITARTPPTQWGLTLPDLLSRLEATSVATLAALDDPLLSALLVKLFSDRQIAPSPRLIDYCVKRMNRSFVAAQALVAELDARSLSSGKPIGLHLAAEILEDQ